MLGSYHSIIPHCHWFPKYSKKTNFDQFDGQFSTKAFYDRFWKDHPIALAASESLDQINHKKLISNSFIFYVSRLIKGVRYMYVQSLHFTNYTPIVGAQWHTLQLVRNFVDRSLQLRRIWRTLIWYKRNQDGCSSWLNSSPILSIIYMKKLILLVTVLHSLISLHMNDIAMHGNEIPNQSRMFFFLTRISGARNLQQQNDDRNSVPGKRFQKIKQIFLNLC